MNNPQQSGAQSEDPRFTHKGWMLFCPIKLAEPYSEAPLVAARWPILDPLFWLSEQVQAVVIGLCSMTSAEYEPQWYFKVTGELK